MCGISGIIGEKASYELITKMTSLLVHRGNDAINHYVDNNIALGHNRLSIIDLNPSSDQPFQSRDFPYIIVFNGEIYNYLEIKIELQQNGYKFRTASDTEVLLYSYIEWGEECLQHLKGMFSFAIWNKIERSLFAARDRFGVKPFYYFYDGKNLIFASEIKAIKSSIKNTEINENVLANYLTYGSYGKVSETFFKGIDQLPAGHFLKFDDSKLSIHQWYDFIGNVKAKMHQNKFIKKNEAIERYKLILERSIALRFRADVPIGVALSGGVDSSLLLTLINKRIDANQVKAFSFYTNNSEYDELPWVNKMIKGTKTKLHAVLFTNSEFDIWHSKITKHQDEPYGGIPTLAYAKLFKTAANHGYKVILDGQGMDETWAGYDYYLSRSSSTIQGQANYNPFKSNVLSDMLKEKAFKPCYPKPFDSELLNKQYRDLFYTKIPRALRFNDRVSMTSTVELREPFLDYELVEFAFSLPENLKINNGQGKYLLRRILSGYNKNIALAPKRALQTPQREWLGNELSYAVDKAIKTISQSSLALCFNIEEMYKEWDLYRNGNNQSSFHLCQWISVSELLNNL